MFSATKLTAFFAVLAAAASAACAAPAGTFDPSNLKEDIVFNPQVTSPAAGDVWTTASTQTITWDTSAIPAEAANTTGLILLGHISPDSSSEHLDIAHPLASGFPITDGAVNVTVPDVMERDDYVVVLFGDSGNTSGKFTIKASSA